jgi:hypothetical protein
MFVRRDGKQYCAIHPDVELTPGAARVKKKLRAIQTCKACDELVKELAQKKSPPNRNLGK